LRSFSVCIVGHKQVNENNVQRVIHNKQEKSSYQNTQTRKEYVYAREFETETRFSDSLVRETYAQT